MKWSVIIIIVLFIISIIMQFLKNRKTKEYSEKLSNLLIEQKYDEFYKMCEDSKTKQYIHPFNIDYIKLNAAIMQDSLEKIKESLDRFDNVRLNKKQKEAVYSNAFSYYIYKENNNGAKRCYEKLKEEGLEKENGIDIVYNIYVEGKHDFLDDMLEQYENVESPREKVQFEPYIIKMYENKKDAANAEKYKNLLQQHIEEMNK